MICSFADRKTPKLFRDGTFFDMAADPQETQPLNQSDLTTEAAAARKELQQILSNLFEPSRKSPSSTLDQ